jgi:zinc transport system permease protein
VTADVADALGWWPDWSLFGEAMLVGWLLSALLPCLGMLLLLRQQLFAAAAIGQAANAGIALAIALGLAAPHAAGHGGAELPARILGFAAAIAAAVSVLRAMSARASTLEARSVFTFLVGGAASLLLLARHPHGAAELQRLQLSSLLCAGWQDAVIAAAFAALAAAALVLRPRLLLGWVLEPASLAVYGQPVARLDLLVGVFAGAVLAHAIGTSGLVFTFGAAVLPVLAARELAGSLRSLLVLAVLCGVAGQTLAVALAHRGDLPPAQVAVVVHGTVAAAARAFGPGGRLLAAHQNRTR